MADHGAGLVATPGAGGTPDWRNDWDSAWTTLPLFVVAGLPHLARPHVAYYSVVTEERSGAMGNLHVILATTLDGFVADANGGLGWIIMGDERADYMVAALDNADTLMLGRKSYEGFIGWRDVPNDPEASEAERTIGERFNAMRKVVFSKSLESADWQGTTILRDIEPEEIRKLKAESETGIRLDGSISIVQQLTRLGLIDEYRLMVHPLALGTGRPLFEERVDLELTGSERFGSGVVVLTYRPAARGN